jgi:hypothetical protein
MMPLPHKSVHPPHFKYRLYDTNKHGVDVVLNGIISILSFVKVGESVRKLKWRDIHA